MITFLIAATVATATVDQCPNGSIYYAKGMEVCVESRVHKGIPNTTRRSSRNAHYIREKTVRPKVRKPAIIHKPNKPFAVERYTRMTKRAVRNQVDHILQDYDANTEKERIRKVQIEYHNSRIR